MTTQRMREQVAEELAERIVDLFARSGYTALKESAVNLKFRAFPAQRAAALNLLAERGEVRRVRDPKTGTTFIQLTGVLHRSDRFNLPGVAAAERARLAELEAERRDALKPTAEEYGTDTASYLFYTDLLAEGKISAEDLPFKLPAQREECPKVRRQRRWKGRGGSRLDFTAGAQAERRRAEGRDFLSPEARRAVDEQLASGDAAWETAKAQYVVGLPTLAHKILHLLSRDGARTEASFVALAEAEELPVPEKAVREAVVTLGEAGKIRKRRGKADGRVYLAPLERMAKRELETLLIGVMADPRSGIPIPADTKLARRVEGFRKAKAEARAERAAEVAAATEQPVEA